MKFLFSCLNQYLRTFMFILYVSEVLIIEEKQQ